MEEKNVFLFQERKEISKIKAYLSNNNIKNKKLKMNILKIKFSKLSKLDPNLHILKDLFEYLFYIICYIQKSTKPGSSFYYLLKIIFSLEYIFFNIEQNKKDSKMILLYLKDIVYKFLKKILIDFQIGSVSEHPLYFIKYYPEFFHILAIY